MEYEVLFPKKYIRLGVKIFLGIAVILGLILVGRAVSPVEGGKPKLLSPRLSAITAYQRDARRWTAELQEIQSGFEELLSNPSGDILAQDGQGNSLYGRLLNLQAEMDGTRVPPTLENLHTDMQEAVTAMLEACSKVAVWITEPTPENASSAEETLQAAADLLARIDQNPWIARP